MYISSESSILSLKWCPILMHCIPYIVLLNKRVILMKVYSIFVRDVSLDNIYQVVCDGTYSMVTLWY